MRLFELAVLYLAVGAGCALLIVVRRHAGTRWWEPPLVLLFWPLYGPFLLSGPVSEGLGARTFEQVLLQMEGTPLSALLPERGEVQALGRRLRLAATRIAEIDRLLVRPEFSQADATARAEAYRARGDARSAASAQGRLANIVRLRALRDRFARELDEVSELLDQLRVQAELVRLSGTPGEGSRELVTELLARVEGLDAVLADEVAA